MVADEVRKLAERSVEATKEIGEVIRQVQAGDRRTRWRRRKAGAAETKEGIALADKAGLALRSIIESVTRSSQLMGEIASATAKQSSASDGGAADRVSNMNDGHQPGDDRGARAGGGQQADPRRPWRTSTRS